MQRMQAQSEDFQSRLQSQMQEMERMRADTQECLRENDACARERALLSQRLQEVEAGLGDVRSQPGPHALPGCQFFFRASVLLNFEQRTKG